MPHSKIARSLLAITLLCILASCAPKRETAAPSVESPAPSPVPASPAEVFENEMRSRIQQAKQANQPTRYAEETVQAWDTPLTGSVKENWSSVHRSTCEDVQSYSGNADEIAQSAYAMNNQTIPLDQLSVFYRIKFESAKIAGC